MVNVKKWWKQNELIKQGWGSVWMAICEGACFGSHLHTQMQEKSWAPLNGRRRKKKKASLVCFTIGCLPTSRLMDRLDWAEVIFVFKLTEVGVERKAAECGFRKMPLNFIARGFLSGKRRNNGLYKTLKFYKYLPILKYPTKSITELVKGADISLGSCSTEGNLIAYIDFRKDESNQDLIKDFEQETKRLQLATLPTLQ